MVVDSKSAPAQAAKQLPCVCHAFVSLVITERRGIGEASFSLYWSPCAPESSRSCGPHRCSPNQPRGCWNRRRLSSTPSPFLAGTLPRNSSRGVLLQSFVASDRGSQRIVRPTPRPCRSGPAARAPNLTLLPRQTSPGLRRRLDGSATGDPLSEPRALLRRGHRHAGRRISSEARPHQVPLSTSG